jgi:hypothetical protein
MEGILVATVARSQTTILGMAPGGVNTKDTLGNNFRLVGPGGDWDGADVWPVSDYQEAEALRAVAPGAAISGRVMATVLPMEKTILRERLLQLRWK